MSRAASIQILGLLSGLLPGVADAGDAPFIQGPPIPLYEPLESAAKEGLFISQSYDASSHFETTTDDVKEIYERATGEKLAVEGLRDGIQVAADE